MPVRPSIQKVCHTKERGRALEQEDNWRTQDSMVFIDHTGRRAREEISNTKETGREETKGPQGNPGRSPREACLLGYTCQSFEQNEAVKSCQIWQ